MKNFRKLGTGVGLGLMCLTVSLLGGNIPEGYVVPEETISPDKQYGVSVPKRSEVIRVDEVGSAADALPTTLRELKTGKKIAEIKFSDDAMDENVLPSRWTPDSTALLWSVDGKWSIDALVLVQLKEGEVVRQTNLLKVGQQEILNRLRKERPKEYAAIKSDLGYGSAYPDGFTVDMVVEGEEGAPLKFPLIVHMYLTSNPKGIEDVENQLDARLNAKVKEDGSFEVTKFYLGTKPASPRWN